MWKDSWNSCHKVTYAVPFSSLSDNWDTALNLGFIKTSLPLSKGMVKMEIFFMLICHLHSSRQTAVSQAAAPLPCF